MTQPELDRLVVELTQLRAYKESSNEALYSRQTELAYAIKANQAIIEQRRLEREEFIEEKDALLAERAGLQAENVQLLTYIQQLEACVALVRSGRGEEGLAHLDSQRSQARKSAA